MPFRGSFDCLWCGNRHACRSETDLEGWATLCPECLGRAQENGFLAGRLRAALAERSSHAAAAAAADAPTAEAFDDWYLRRGAFARGPVHDVPWRMELDAAARWLDGLDLGPIVVELGAGTGFWSPLLAQRAELWAYETEDVLLAAARDRLVAHGLRAHLHLRDPLGEPVLTADTLFAAMLLGSVADEELAVVLGRLRGWLRPAGRVCLVELSGPAGATFAGPRGPVAARPPDAYRGLIEACGFEHVSASMTGHTFTLLSAKAQDPAHPTREGRVRTLAGMDRQAASSGG